MHAGRKVHTVHIGEGTSGVEVEACFTKVRKVEHT